MPFFELSRLQGLPKERKVFRLVMMRRTVIACLHCTAGMRADMLRPAATTEATVPEAQYCALTTIIDNDSTDLRSPTE